MRGKNVRNYGASGSQGGREFEDFNQLTVSQLKIEKLVVDSRANKVKGQTCNTTSRSKRQ